MSAAGRIIVAAGVAAALAAPPARAATGDYCVGVDRPDCTAAATLPAALAQPDRVNVFVGAGTFTAPASDGGTPVTITGAGIDETELGRLELSSSGSLVSGVSLDGRLDVAGRAERVEARRGVRLLAGADPATTAQLAQATVEDGVQSACWLGTVSHCAATAIAQPVRFPVEPESTSLMYSV
jgi:hypothetical protein